MHLYKLHFIYKESNGDLSTFLKLYKLSKTQGIGLRDLEWFAHMVEIGTYKIPEIKNQYAEIKNELEAQLVDRYAMIWSACSCL
jgi:hypothetical protein